MASDSFTNTDGTSLSTHNANWGTIGGTIFTIQSNCAYAGTWAVREARYTASSADLSQVVWKGSISAVQADVAKVHVRMSSSTEGYASKPNVSGGNVIGLILTKNGSWLGSLTGGGNPSVSLDLTLKITASGTSTVTVEGFINGTSVGTATDSSSPIAAGNPGFRSWGGASAVYFDDWTDGASAAAAGAPPPWMLQPPPFHHMIVR